MAVKLYADKNSYGLQTEALDEATFRQEFVTALALLIETHAHAGEWHRALHRWIGQMVDICHTYQGHKPETVDTRVLYTAGATPPLPDMTVPVDSTKTLTVPVLRETLRR